MTPDVAKTLLLPIIEGKSYQHNLKWMTPKAANYFLLSISKEKVLPTKTQVHHSRCCKRLFSSPSARGSLTYLNIKCNTPNLAYYLSSAYEQERSLTHPNSSDDSKCCKLLFSYPSARGESNELKLKCITPDVRNDFSPAHNQGWSHTLSNYSDDSRCFKLLFACLLQARRLSHPKASA